MCTKSLTRRVTYLLLFASLCALSASMHGQELTLTVDDPRPLAAAVANLEDRFGWVVTYEDPRYLHPEDAQDVTQAVQRNHQPGQARTLVPRGGPFTFVAQIGSAVSQEPEVLRALLEQYAAFGYPGTFTVRRTGSVFHVIPTATRNAQGAQELYESVLDKRVSQTAGTRTAMDAVAALAAQVGLMVGRLPTPMFGQTMLNQDAASDTARNLLMRILRATTVKPLSWRVLCDPGDGRPCVLNIRMVGVPLQGR
jgi:hypothetical protein